MADARIGEQKTDLAKAYQLYKNEQQWLKQALFGSFDTYYRSFWALKDISFDIRKGDAVGIVGRNGCGKWMGRNSSVAGSSGTGVNVPPFTSAPKCACRT